MSITMVGRRQKILKLNWLKCSKTAQKRNLDQKIYYSKPHIWSLFFNLKANKNKQKRSLILQYSFTKKTSLILQTPTHSTLQKIYFCHFPTLAKNFPQLHLYEIQFSTRSALRSALFSVPYSKI